MALLADPITGSTVRKHDHIFHACSFRKTHSHGFSLWGP